VYQSFTRADKRNNLSIPRASHFRISWCNIESEAIPKTQIFRSDRTERTHLLMSSTITVPLPTASPDERLNRLDGAMQAEIDAGHYAGISVMVARHGKLVKSGCYGYQALEGRKPLREDAIYRIASMTKPTIAVAMLLLYEEGKWQLDDPVTTFIPEFADLKVLKDGQLVPLDRPMTMRHLMASSAGFAFGPAFGTSNPKVDEMYAKADLWSGTNDDIIPKLAKLPLEAQPGTEFRYGLQQEVQLPSLHPHSSIKTWQLAPLNCRLQQ
jgi:CubicO group peptidase (beta-lactamase class C family)